MWNFRTCCSWMFVCSVPPSVSLYSRGEVLLLLLVHSGVWLEMPKARNISGSFNFQAQPKAVEHFVIKYSIYKRNLFLISFVLPEMQGNKAHVKWSPKTQPNRRAPVRSDLCQLHWLCFLNSSLKCSYFLKSRGKGA